MKKKIKQRSRKIHGKEPSAETISEHMRKVVNVRWARYRQQAAAGALSQAAFKPTGPLPPRQREKGALKKMESAIGRARLFNAAMRNEQLTPGEIRKINGEHRKPRRYIRHGGKAPVTTGYRPLVKFIANRIRKRFAVLGWELPA